MLRLKVWIDADSCPVLVRNYVVEKAVSLSFNVCFVANRSIPFATDLENLTMIVCEKSNQAADNYIYDNAEKNDLVITRDILFAEKLVKKQIKVLNDRGLVFTKDNIIDKIAERNFSMNLSALGLNSGKKSNYSEKQLKKFASTFEYEIQKHITNEIYNIKV